MKKEKINPEGIFIIGAPRSGTTLLRRILNAHPNIACPPETYLFRSCARFLQQEVMLEGLEVGVLAGLSHAGFTEKEILDSLRDFAFTFLRKYTQRQGKKRWAEKTAFNSFFLEEIEKLCGDHSFFICIQRHGLDVACSMKALCDQNGGFLEDLHSYILRYQRPLEAFSHAWVDLVGEIREFACRHPKNSIVIKYEDLVNEPDQTMQKVMNAIGEKWSSEYLNMALNDKNSLGLGDWKTYAKTKLDPSSIGAWKNLSKTTISMMGSICNRMLVENGYEPVELASPVSQSDVTHRQKLALMVKALSENIQN